MLHTRSLFSLVLLGVALALPAQAQPASEIEALLRDRDREIKAILTGDARPTDAQRTRLREVVNAAIDFGAMAEQALGRYWNELAPAQRSAFTERFGAVVRAQSLADLELYRARVAYDGVEVEGGRATAHTTATFDGKTAEVDYHLRRTDAGWRVTDIVIDGTGTAAGYARSFQRVMKQQGVEEGYARLMRSLERRLERDAS